jgi:hypothetical protein
VLAVEAWRRGGQLIASGIDATPSTAASRSRSVKRHQLPSGGHVLCDRHRGAGSTSGVNHVSFNLPGVPGNVTTRPLRRHGSIAIARQGINLRDISGHPRSSGSPVARKPGRSSA